MDTEDVQENTGEPKGEEIPFTFWSGLYTFGLPITAWLSGAALLSYVLATGGLALWIAVIAGFVFGVVSVGLWLRTLSGESIMEGNVAAVQGLVLVLILFFVFHHAHETRLKNEARHKASANVASPVK